MSINFKEEVIGEAEWHNFGSCSRTDSRNGVQKDCFKKDCDTNREFKWDFLQKGAKREVARRKELGEELIERGFKRENFENMLF